MDELSIQELRQALRERGVNSRGSKKQLMQRLSEQYGFQSTSVPAATPAATKVRVTLQKSRQQACMLLIDPSLAPEHNLNEFRQKTVNKFRFRPNHFYLVDAAPNGGVELTSDNLREYLKDGLIVLASQNSMNKLHHALLLTAQTQVPAVENVNAQQEDAAQTQAQSSSSESRESLEHLTTDSGSCSSAEDAELDLMEEQRSIKSFDSDSLYSYQQNESKEESDGQQQSQRYTPNGTRKKRWMSMLPKATDQPTSNSSSIPSHSPTLRPVPVPAYVPSSLLTAPHSHKNHHCSSSSSSFTSTPRIPSLMDEIVGPSSSSNSCACCESGCEIDFTNPSASATSANPSLNLPLVRSHSTPTPVPGQPSTSPAPAAASSSSSSSSSAAPVTLESLRIAELERANRRLDSSLRSYLKSDTELRARVASFEQGATMLPSLEEEFKSLRVSSEIREKELTKLQWERDRTKIKHRQLMEKNNELKADKEAYEILKKEHAALQQSYSRLSGENINASTPPPVLQELLLHHTTAIQRVHQQMTHNIARDKKELHEARLCKICMAKPSDTILLPCSHFVLCGHCASGLDKCCICRTKITDKRPVYL